MTVVRAQAADCARDAGFQDCALRRAGAMTLAEHAARGDAVVQFYRVSLPYGQSDLVQFIAPKNGTARMEVRDFFDKRPPLVVSLAPAIWRDVANLWRRWVGGEAAVARARWQVAQPPPGVIVARPDHCQWGEASSNFDGKVAALAYDMCDTPWTYDLINALYEAVLRAAPYCKESGLAYCVRLHGDRELASAAAVALHGMENDGGAGLRRYLGQGAALTFSHGRSVSGTRKIIRTLARWRAGYLDASSLEGRDGMVTIAGVMLAGTRDESDTWFTAPFRQVWRRGPDGNLRLVRWWIGDFTPAE